MDHHNKYNNNEKVLKKMKSYKWGKKMFTMPCI